MTSCESRSTAYGKLADDLVRPITLMENGLVKSVVITEPRSCKRNTHARAMATRAGACSTARIRVDLPVAAKRRQRKLSQTWPLWRLLSSRSISEHIGRLSGSRSVFGCELRAFLATARQLLTASLVRHRIVTPLCVTRTSSKNRIEVRDFSPPFSGRCSTQSKKLDPHQRFSLRIGYEETIHSFLHDVGRACSGLLRSGQSGKAS
jgi:hypothetical protein